MGAIARPWTYDAKNAAKSLGWQQVERGWWTKDGLGGICMEADRRWWFYPVEGERYGTSFPTLTRAIYHAERATPSTHAENTNE